jgi:hypothetical protein
MDYVKQRSFDGAMRVLDGYMEEVSSVDYYVSFRLLLAHSCVLY